MNDVGRFFIAYPVLYLTGPVDAALMLFDHARQNVTGKPPLFASHGLIEPIGPIETRIMRWVTKKPALDIKP